MTRKSDFQQWFETHRDAAEKARAERKERRLMKTSTYEALAESVGEIEDDAEQMVREDLLADTIAVERRRWLERAQWIVLGLIMLGLGWTAGWYSQPEFKPQPWDCTVKVVPDAPLVEPTIMRCVGGEMPE